ncbi:SRPBCC family protein [Candidatus Enterococcus clewellii]|uniref:Polyketide cyclase n=1 Tax=Candidatus Enterococcus clewellii TaxID=1834193 RepID=A0A242KCZ9_9ENTE|nr:SRPBCC family protein [Enterococcus sp. 9E7_DIV0242]OTP19045.1 hypothetical protein A5888_000859 [Enterococcus sp. 9E7_DIV0242]
MATATVKAVFDCEIEQIWSIVTSLTDYSWRSDLDRVEIISNTKFIEYTPEGYTTTFTITATDYLNYWSFDLENDNIKGSWTGSFSRKGEKTEIVFTENVTAKKLWMKPFVKAYLKKQQAQYMKDLRAVI